MCDYPTDLLTERNLVPASENPIVGRNRIS
jgi:hypothetical protein